MRANGQRTPPVATPTQLANVDDGGLRMSPTLAVANHAQAAHRPWANSTECNSNLLIAGVSHGRTEPDGC
jgi:hypothetical protein